MSLSSRHRFTKILLSTLILLGLAVGPAAAQELRYVTGEFFDFWNRYDPPGLSTTVMTVGGRDCGPNQTTMDPCQGNKYPFVGGVNVRPIRATGAIQQAGLGQGEDVNFPYASEWTQATTGMIPAGVIPGVLSIFTSYDGRNAQAVPATGKGLAAGQGPGSIVFNPLAAGVPGSTMFQTVAWPNATSFPGQTTILSTPVSTNFPALTAQTINQFGAEYTAGPRQFGGTAAILTDTPNRLTLQFPATVFQRTNGKCRRDAQENAGVTVTVPFGDCQVGFAWGTTRRFTSVRRNVSQTTTPNQTAPPLLLGQHGYWQGNLWTTGTITVRSFIDSGNAQVSESFALSGTDEITPSGARHLVLVSPILNYDKDLFGAQGGSVHIGLWDMTIQTPEPGATAALLAGLGLLGGLSWRSRRRS